MDDATLIFAAIGDLEVTRRKQFLQIQELTKENEALRQQLQEILGDENHVPETSPA